MSPEHSMLRGGIKAGCCPPGGEFASRASGWNALSIGSASGGIPCRVIVHELNMPPKILIIFGIIRSNIRGIAPLSQGRCAVNGNSIYQVSLLLVLS